MSTQTVLQAPQSVLGELREQTAIPAREIPAVCEAILKIAQEVISDPPTPEDLEETMAWVLSEDESGASFLNCCRIVGSDLEGAHALRERFCRAYLEKKYGRGKKGRDQIVALVANYNGDLCQAVSVQVSRSLTKDQGSKTLAGDSSPRRHRANPTDKRTDHCG